MFLISILHVARDAGEGNSLTEDTGIKTPFFLPQLMCQMRRVALIWLLFKPFWNLAFCNQFKFQGRGVSIVGNQRVILIDSLFHLWRESLQTQTYGLR